MDFREDAGDRLEAIGVDVFLGGLDKGGESTLFQVVEEFPGEAIGDASAARIAADPEFALPRIGSLFQIGEEPIVNN